MGLSRSRSGRRQQQEAARKGSIHERLYEEGKGRLARVEERAKLIPAGCTFAPSILVGASPSPAQPWAHLMSTAHECHPGKPSLTRGIRRSLSPTVLSVCLSTLQSRESSATQMQAPTGRDRTVELYEKGKAKVAEERIKEWVRRRGGLDGSTSRAVSRYTKEGRMQIEG